MHKCAAAFPWPGVVLTITNALRYGFAGAIAGIMGIAIGTLFIASISATSLAIVLAASAMAFTTLKFIGAAYLLYLGIKMWRSTAKIDIQNEEKHKSPKLRLSEELLVTLLNPKPVFFFMALFPQFITSNENHQIQFIVLAATFSFLVVVIHCIYAAISKIAKSKLSTSKGRKFVGRISGSFYMLFEVGLATSNKSL